MLTQTLTTDKYNSWKIDPKSLLAFSTDQRIYNLANKFLLSPPSSFQSEAEEARSISTSERNITQMLVLQTYDCLTHDKLHGLPIFMDLMHVSFR